MGIADLFRPKHRHSNVEVRAQAVRQLSDEESALVVDIARRDAEPSIRRIAIEKLDDPTILVELAENESDRSVRELARARAVHIWVNRAVSGDPPEEAASALEGLVALGDQRAIADVASRASSIELRDAALANLDDDKALAELARGTNTHMGARTTAIARISDVEVLRSIAVDETRKDIATLALERLDDAKCLEEVAQKAKSKTARARARKRLASMREQLEKPAVSHEERRRRAERTQLLHRAEALAQVEEWVESAREMEQIQRDFEALGPSGDASLDARYERACARYQKRLAAYQARQAAHEADRAERARQVQEPVSEPEPAESPVDATAAEQPETEQAAAEPSDDASAADASAADQAEAEEKLARERERAEKRRERREQALAELATLTQELLEGAASDKLKGAEKLLQRADKALAESHLGDTDDERVRAFTDARQALVVRIHELREAAGWQQWANIAQQEVLIEQAKALLADEDKNNLGARLKNLQSAWKAVGPAPRKKGQELWEQFKAICDQIYEHVKAERARQGEVLNANLEKKTALCERAEALSESTDWQKTAEDLKQLQREWKAIGPVPRKKSDALWKRFRSACDAFFERRKPFMEELQAEYVGNLEKKTALCERAEELSESTDWKETATKLRDLQREWRAIGLVPRKDASAINKRFRAACDHFFNRRKEFEAQQAREREERLEALAAEISAIAAALEVGGADVDVADLVTRTMSVRKTLRELAPSGEPALHDHANALFAAMVEAHGEHFKGTDLDPAASRAKKQKLLAKAEELAPKLPEERADANAQSAEEMAAKLRAALAENALASTLANSTDGRNLADAVAELRDSWRVIGPVPGPEGEELERRFQGACERTLRSAGIADGART